MFGQCRLWSPKSGFRNWSPVWKVGVALWFIIVTLFFLGAATQWAGWEYVALRFYGYGILAIVAYAVTSVLFAILSIRETVRLLKKYTRRPPNRK